MRLERPTGPPSGGGPGYDQAQEVAKRAELRIGSIVIRCCEFDRMLAFWQEALRYVPRQPPQDSSAVLRDPAGRGPNLSLDRAPDRRTGKRP